jgi:hypothetical protein
MTAFFCLQDGLVKPFHPEGKAGLEKMDRILQRKMKVIADLITHQTLFAHVPAKNAHDSAMQKLTRVAVAEIVRFWME